MILKSVTFDFFKYKLEEFNSLGIVDVIEMKSKVTNKSYNFVKALIQNEEKKQALLNERFIRIGLSKIYLEDFIKPPVQCRNCKGFGHIEKFCKLKYKCAKCGEEHNEESCQKTNDEQKCVNCKGNHSTYYRGCSEYREAKNLKSLKIKNPSSPNSFQHTEVRRMYSSVAATNNNSDDLLKKFGSLLITNNAVIIEQTKAIVKEETKTIVKEECTAVIERIKTIMKQNNTNLCYFIINTIKTLVPNVQFCNTIMSYIEKAFSEYKLGEIKSEELSEHFCQNKHMFLKQVKNCVSGGND